MTKGTFLIILFFVNISCGFLNAQHNPGNSVKTKVYHPETNLVVWPEAFKPEKAKWYVHNEIDINASPEVVWKLLIDAKNWHTYYQGVESEVEYLDPDATTLRDGLAFKMHTMGLHLEPVIKEFVPNERMAWEVNRRNLKAYHAWVIVPTSDGCRLITPEAQNGFLAVMQTLFLPNKLLNLHEDWLELIKQKAENKPN